MNGEQWDRIHEAEKVYNEAASRLAIITDALDKIDTGAEDARYWDHTPAAIGHRERQRQTALRDYRAAKVALDQAWGRA